MSNFHSELVTRFGVWDYVVFSGMLAVSAVIGLFYACTGGKQSTTKEFLMADGNMGVFPVALSLLASFMSAVTLLGTPAEVYNYTSIYNLIIISHVLTIPVAAYLYLPIFRKLKVTSSYEYLERRFNKSIRRMGSLIYIIQMSLYMSVVLYAPALALNQVTGLHIWGSVSAIGIVCTFYTTVGGMKAVMWTDAFQIFIMFGSMLTVIIKGCINAGGFKSVWQKNLEGGRILFDDFRPDPRVRHSFWSLTIGGFFTWTAVYCINQAQVQRYLTTPTKKMAQQALWWNLIGMVSLVTICCFGGLVIYATYWNCDPFKSELIKEPDQLLPLFVMDTLGNFPGLPGLFVAGVFSGALSTISSGMNSLAAVTYEDFVKTCCLKRLTEKRAALVSKLLAMSYGVLCIALVAVAEELGDILQAALGILGLIGGPLLGVFSLGMFFPHANSWGAGVGLICGIIGTFWIGAGAHIYKHYMPSLKSPISVDGCLLNLNKTENETIFTPNKIPEHFVNINESSTTIDYISTDPSSSVANLDILEIYKLSYLWYSFIGFTIVLIIGLIISYMTGKQDPAELDPKVISPLVRKLGFLSSSELEKPKKLVDSSKTVCLLMPNIKKTETGNILPNGVEPFETIPTNGRATIEINHLKGQQDNDNDTIDPTINLLNTSDKTENFRPPNGSGVHISRL